MSILTKSAIRQKIQDGSIVISPFDESQLNPNSYDVRLGDTLAVYERGISEWEGINGLSYIYVPFYEMYPMTANMARFDCKNPDVFRIINFTIPESGIILMPGILYLATTLEYTESHDTAPYLDGKSSTARAGMKIHLTAGRGDIGFCGHWTMEIEVTHPIRVYAGMKVGQITWHTVEGEIETTYKETGQYNNRSNVPMGSGIWKQFREGDGK